MADKSEPSILITEDSLANKISEGVTRGIASLQPKKVTVGEYIRRQPKLPKLRRVIAQNGYPGQNLTAQEIALANRLTHSGQYMNRKVRVILNTDNTDETIDIHYPNRTPDMKLEMATPFNQAQGDTVFEKVLRQLVEVQEQEDKEAERMSAAGVPIGRR